MSATQPASAEDRGGDPQRAGLVPMPAARGGRRGRKRGGGRGALVVIAGLLVMSAVIRIGLGLNGAIALETGQEAAAPEPASDAANMALLAALQAREERLAKAEAAYEDRRQALALAEKTIDEKLGALTAAEAALSATIARAETASEDDLAKLTAVYENMKPADAAAVFEAMSPDFAAGFLGRMRPEAAAGVMAGLTPETAYSISVLLAGRNAGVPKR